MGVFISMLGIFFGLSPKEQSRVSMPEKEITELREVSWDYEAYAKYFTELAKSKGSVFAYRVLAQAPIADGIDTHTLAHAIGYVLYAEKGANGLGDCTSEFQNGCAHAVIIQELVENGDGALRGLLEVCAQKPEGTESAVACFHGLGHGLIAYTKYDFKSAVRECREVRDFLKPLQSYSTVAEMWGECVGGATMELSHGIHDREARDLVKPLYMPPEDILMPCDAPYVEKEVRPSCYLYMRQRFFVAAGRTHTDRVPNPKTYAKALSYCTQIPADEQGSIKACYGGFGVDFVYFANNNDGRNLSRTPVSALDNIHTWCGLSPNHAAVSACTLTAVGILTGDPNDLSAPIRFCSRAPDAEISKRCFGVLVPIAKKELDQSGFSVFCDGLPEQHRKLCTKTD